MILHTTNKKNSFFAIFTGVVKCKCNSNTEINSNKNNFASNRFRPIRINHPTFWQIIKTLTADPRLIQTQVWGCNSNNK